MIIDGILHCALYELRDSRDDRPFYVGIGNNPEQRYRQHLRDTKCNPLKINKIREIHEADAEVKLHIVGWYPDNITIEHLEAGHIWRLGLQGHKLTNATNNPFWDGDAWEKAYTEMHKRPKETS